MSGFVAMADLPSGAVTFLFTDIEGSTALVKQLRGRYGEALQQHQRLLRKAFAEQGGREIDTQGDAFFYVFADAHEAVVAAVEGQRALAGFSWPEGASVKVRIGIHTGHAAPVDGRYTGLVVHRAARICAAGHGGQVLVSQATQSMIEDDEEDLAVQLRDLGEQRLKDIDRPVRLYQVVAPGLPESFPPLRKGEPAPPRRLWLARRPLVLVTATALVLAVAAAAVLLATRSGGGGARAGLARVAPDSLATVDPITSKITSAVRIPQGPSLVAAGRRLVWTASDSARTISSISAESGTVTKVFALDVVPSAIATNGDAVWVLDGSRRVLLKIDPESGTATRRIELPVLPSPATSRRPGSFSVSAGEGALWVTDGSTRLLRVDMASGKARGLDVHEPLNDVAVGTGSVWAISGQAASVFQIDDQAHTIRPGIHIVNELGTAVPFPLGVAFGEGSVWVLNGNTQTVTRIDPKRGAVAETIPLGIGRNPGGIAVGAGAVWVANVGDGTIVRIDPRTRNITTTPLGSSPTDVAVGDGRVWLALQPGFRAGMSLSRNALSGPPVHELPLSSCSGLEFKGKGEPRYLIASDLPFQRQSDVGEILQLSDAIRFILARHRFRAGRYSVGYQSCDDSSPQTGSYDASKCRSNASAYAATRDILGVIGAYNSGCAADQIAVLAVAPAGPLGMISPAATYVGLTRSGPGSVPGEPQRYQPHGERSFVRIVAADDIQGAADAILAKRLGVERLYLLHDSSTYGLGIASNVRRAAIKLGVRIAGFTAWDPEATTYAGITQLIQRSGADAVFLGGSLTDSNGAAVVKSLRAALGQRVSILTPDGFTPIAAFAQLAGPAAEGATVSFPATPPERLLDQGQRFVSEFRKAIGRPVEPYSVAAAQATEVLLDAIGRSNGSRASVTARLFKTKVSNGILGSFSIDRHGDTTAGAVTIYRIVKGLPQLIGVIVPPPSLVRSR
jgi:branched-chain amino acid transport system substrate-binding protein